MREMIEDLINRKSGMIAEREAQRREEVKRSSRREVIETLGRFQTDPTLAIRVHHSSAASSLASMGFRVRKSSWIFRHIIDNGGDSWLVTVPDRK